MTAIVSDGLLCVLELAILSLFFGMDLMAIGSFIFFFLNHFFLTGTTLCLLAAKLNLGEKAIPEVVTIGVISDCALLAIAWRFDFIGFYAFYPIIIFAVFLVLFTSRSSSEDIFGWRDLPLVRVVLSLQIIPPLLWLFSIDSTDRHFIDQIVGVQVLSHWPPANLFVADIPYSNNYVLHLLLSATNTLTNIDVVLLVTRISPIFLSWLFARSLFYFCRTYLNLPWVYALLPGLCFFIVFGYSPVIGHIFGTPTVIPAVRVQSTLLSFPIVLAIVMMQSALPRNVLPQGILLCSLVIAAFIGTGARAQLGPIIICAQSLLLLQALMTGKLDVLVWRGTVLAALLLAVGAALVFFLTVTGGFTGTSFLKIEANPAHFIMDLMYWFYAAQWLSNIGVNPTWAAMVAFVIIIVAQSSFLLPGLLCFIRTCWIRGFLALRPSEVLLLGMIIAGTVAVSLTEAVGGSQYVFLHYSKIAAIILGAVGLSECIRNDRVRLRSTVWVLGATMLFAAVHVIDASIEFFRWAPTNFTNALKPHPLPDARLVSELRHFLDNYEDRKRSVFIYDGSLSQLGSYVLPAQLGLQLMGDPPFLEEYAKWKSSAQGALQRRLCLMEKFNKAANDRLVGGNLIYALSSTLLRSYDAVYVVMSAKVSVTLPKQFELREGPDFSVYLVPWASVSQEIKDLSGSDMEGC
jgi:hypothetical protein